MKTSLLLLAAPLAATAFLLPDEQQILSVFATDGDDNSNNAIAAADHHEQPNVYHHYESEEAVDSYDIQEILEQPAWHHISGLAGGLQWHIAHADVEIADFEGPHPPKGKKCPHSKFDKKNKDKKDRKHKGKKEKKETKEKKEKHHELELAEQSHHSHHAHGTELDVFDIPPRPKPGFFDKAKGQLRRIFGPPDHRKPGDGHGKPPVPAGFPHHPHHHHRAYNQTIYELISNSNHTRIFTKIINQYDEVVKYLNSTEANYTIFVPVDEAFKHFHHKPNASRGAVLKWLEYHISPKIFTKRDFFDVQTVPTFLPEENDSLNPQRISTQAGFRGFSLNFYSHVIRPDIFATNGVIHGIDKFLIPPLGAAETLELVPSVFSTLNLALIKTGLIDIFNAKVPKSGGTFFAPSNRAFARLGPKINAFLFSHAGRPYLKALLKYHIIANHTLFSDVYYKPASSDETLGEEGQHLDLPTLLHDKPLSVDIHHLHRVAHIVLNNNTHVLVPNVPVKEGVIHLVTTVIIPPRPHPGPDRVHEKEEEELLDHRDHLHEHPHEHSLSVRDLMERLERFIE